MAERKAGTVYLVGAGPGDPGLLTRRGEACLRRCDAVVYDTLVSPALLGLAPPGALRIHRGSRGRRGALTQAALNRLLARLARRGLAVVRLKGGDPFVFGRGGEEAEYLARRGIPFEVVPGVTSAIAVPAYAGIPVTHRRWNSSLTLATAHEAGNSASSRLDWAHFARHEGTLVFLMGLRTLPQVCANLLREGKDPATPAAVIRSGTTAGQCTVAGTLRNLPARVRRAELAPPALLVVGDVVRSRRALDWIRRRPLLGRRVLLTSESGAAAFGPLEDLGAEVIRLPLRRYAVDPRAGNPWRGGRKFDWIFLTSPRGVEIWFSALLSAGRDVRSTAGLRFACVGAKTAGALLERGVTADLVAREARQEGLVRALEGGTWKGVRVLLAQAREARPLLAQELRRRGARVTRWSLYESHPDRSAAPALRALFTVFGGVDAVVFGSALAVETFHALLPSELRREAWKRTPAAVLGSRTARTVRRFGGRVAVFAGEASWEALAAALRRRLSGRRR